MSTQVRDLWPDSISSVDDVTTPVAIIKQQAAFLGRRTNNLVEIAVRPGSAAGQDFLYYVFLVAPALGDYRYLLLQITHGVDLYPVNVLYAPTSASSSAETEAAFLEQLQDFFTNEKTVKVIRSLIAQSRS
jgi:hypothetical protein